jgi:hypothetical protein
MELTPFKGIDEKPLTDVLACAATEQYKIYNHFINQTFQVRAFLFLMRSAE